MRLRGLTQKDLAGKIGRSEATVSRWIGEHRLPGLHTIVRVSKATGASVDYLLGVSNEPPPEAGPTLTARETRELRACVDTMAAFLDRLGHKPGRE